MRTIERRIVLAVFSFFVGLGPSASAFAKQCAELEGQTFADATIVSAQAVSADALVNSPEISASIQAMAKLSGQSVPNAGAGTVCRVKGELRPSPTSDIKFELWIPLDQWNKRLWMVGNGGFGGYIAYSDLILATARGYATASTDTGHDKGSANPEAFADPERYRDWADRAVHLTAVASKAIILQLSGERPQRSYFSGCSNGGRQALVAAQRFPDDFDGILAGAPAVVYPVIASNLHAAWLLQSDAGKGLTVAKLANLHAAVLARCDAQDGVKDGMVSLPLQCDFKPAKLLCGKADADSCLTVAQLDVVQRLYAGMGGSMKPKRDLRDGYPMGSELMWPAALYGAAASSHWVETLVHPGAPWTVAQYDPQNDVPAIRKSGELSDASNADLSRFAARGGKLLLYTGMAETLVPFRNTVDYAEKVMRSSSGSKDYFAFFEVPAMGHCGGGPLALFNQGAGADRNLEIDRDPAAMLQSWVEDRRPPEKIVVGEFIDPKAPLAERKIKQTRVLCPHPKIARWNQRGAATDAANFDCVIRGR